VILSGSRRRIVSRRKIAEIRPETEKTTEPSLAAIDKAADQLGFRSREAEEAKSCVGVGRSAPARN